MAFLTEVCMTPFPQKLIDNEPLIPVPLAERRRRWWAMTVANLDLSKLAVNMLVEYVRHADNWKGKTSLGSTTLAKKYDVWKGSICRLDSDLVKAGVIEIDRTPDQVEFKGARRIVTLVGFKQLWVDAPADDGRATPNSYSDSHSYSHSHSKPSATAPTTPPPTPSPAPAPEPVDAVADLVESMRRIDPNVTREWVERKVRTAQKSRCPVTDIDAYLATALRGSGCQRPRAAREIKLTQRDQRHALDRLRHCDEEARERMRAALIDRYTKKGQVTPANRLRDGDECTLAMALARNPDILEVV